MIGSKGMDIEKFFERVFCMISEKEKSVMEKLQEPFPSSEIEWRVQRVVKTKNGYKAIVMPYITNRAIQNRLDEVFGVFGWQNEFKRWGENGVICGISIKDEDGNWITKWDGADEGGVEAVKAGFSNSSKRAAVALGIGRYLYNLESQWVDIKNTGQNFINTKIKDYENGRVKEEQVKGYWDNPFLPDWALPKSERKESQKKDHSSIPSVPVNEQLISYVKEMENVLGLTDEHKMRIYMRCNPESTVRTMTDLYGHSEPELKRYLTAIKLPAQLKRFVEGKEVNEQQLFSYLGTRLDMQVKSYIHLITFIDETLYNEVREMIEQQVVA